MNIRYKCLILDHDDTAVDSTAEIHYPAHVKVLEELRPGLPPVTLEGWFLKNFNVGIMEFLTEELEFTDSEIERELAVWRSYTSSIIPNFYPGFLDILSDYRKLGGFITVVSHSEKDVISNHYQTTTRGKIMPDMIFGWDYDSSRRKPSVWPVNEILKRYNLRPDEALIVDDLKPGVVMAGNAGVPIAAAGWAYTIPEIEDYMRENCFVYLDKVEDLRRSIFSD